MPTPNRYPIYIVSKGRWESRRTNRALAAMGIDHFVVVEAQEAEQYQAHLERATLIILDPAYQRDYELCDDLGLSKSTGPGPARNCARDHAIANGHAWHWVMDDNIDGFFRLNHNLKTPAVTPAIFRAMEDFCDRYTNLGMAGPNYFMFASRKELMPAFVMNTRIYSCNLIRHDTGLIWRGRYNEDTDLSLRMLKAGWCTVQFNAFLQDKMLTQTMAGGCTTEFYAEEGTRPKSELLQRMHPDVATVGWRFGRWHHFVDYGRWKSMPLRRKPGLAIPEGVDNYGMRLEQQVDGRWVPIDKPRAVAKTRYVNPPLEGGSL